MLDSLHLRGAPLSEPQVAAVAAGALCALQHLHQDCHMLHRDLKAASFLLNPNPNPKPKPNPNPQPQGG